MNPRTIVERDPHALEAYGALREGIHIAGYTFERACDRLEWLLEEDRWRSVGTGFDNVNTFLASIRLDNLKAPAEARKRIAARIKELQPEVSNRTIAKVLGVGKDTVNRDLGANAPAPQKTPSEINEPVTPVGANAPLAIAGAAAAILVRRREERKMRNAEAAAARPRIGGEGSFECRHGDFRAVLGDLGNVDAVITDPPYGKEYIPLLRDLAAFADRILKPDGIMAVLYGQTYLPEAFAQMTGFRPYRWTACYLMKGNASYTSHPRKLHSNWKPVLVYGGTEHRFNDLFKAGDDGPDKEHHKWGQNLEAFQIIIAALTKPGATIVDPFAGGGTTLIAAKSLGRHAIGSEIDANAKVFQLADIALKAG